MFHTYVQAYTRKMVDFDRASYLMDKTLLPQAIEAMETEQREYPRHDADYGPQWIWDYYCQRHAEKYGEYFRPNVDPTWDQGAS